ncbi:hypothetical protein RINTHH_14080 [Richelia intracellularis HH01]|uniref:Uncharacterized protein n=1 Tax=Richelia intracellularis HH01 TaxID=1165094 RepID=M1X0K7_9NOST|nr:hypothetical protein RINTHH_14080 [Richelia intracellularis HH01]
MCQVPSRKKYPISLQYTHKKSFVGSDLTQKQIQKILTSYKKA